MTLTFPGNESQETCAVISPFSKVSSRLTIYRFFAKFPSRACAVYAYIKQTGRITEDFKIASWYKILSKSKYIKVGRTHGASYRGYGYVPLGFGEERR